MQTTLAVIYHDPEGRLYEQIGRVLPTLARIFPSIAMHASPTAYPAALRAFADAGARLHQYLPGQVPVGAKLGAARRACLEAALTFNTPFILYCDCDAALHWAEQYPQEMAQVSQCVHARDFTVIGRTPRALDTLPAVQRDTEGMVNRVFASITGLPWQVTVGARGLSQRAARAILSGCPDDEFTTDVSWLLFLRREGGFSLGYLEADGLEFETADKYAPEVAAAGGKAEWIAGLDRDPHRWIERMRLAGLEIEAMLRVEDGSCPG